VDTPDEGAPVVHAIKENSVLIDQVKVGDRLIGVDEIDVRSSTATQVSKLMSQRSTNPVRKLTFTRGTIDVDDDETAYRGETAIQVKSTSPVDTGTQGESHGMAFRMWRVGIM
jgi:C-terminal processing protease CtpA/Prc